ncbi:hypothetical protein OY671_007146 [Metschnikowia pulcherrima]|nr:hypothetical protein OY671_007146 [Metschnikowia pulcherrima]
MGTESTHSSLVYARSGSGEDEPRVSCVSDSAEITHVESELARINPELEVRWESVPWQHTEPGVGRVGSDVVHVVSVGSPRNSIGLRAFDSRHDAESFAVDYAEETVVETCRSNDIDRQASE